MTHGSTHILRAVIIMIGLVVLGLCVFVLPIGLRSDATGYYRPIILGMYVAAMLFFYSLSQALTVLGLISKNQAFTQASVDALKKIKYCALAISGIFATGMPYVFYVADKDDAPGVAAAGFVIIGASFVVGTAAAVFQKLLQNAVDIKSENDLTV